MKTSEKIWVSCPTCFGGDGKACPDCLGEGGWYISKKEFYDGQLVVISIFAAIVAVVLGLSWFINYFT